MCNHLHVENMTANSGILLKQYKNYFQIFSDHLQNDRSTVAPTLGQNLRVTNSILYMRYSEGKEDAPHYLRVHSIVHLLPRLATYCGSWVSNKEDSYIFWFYLIELSKITSELNESYRESSC